jgi:hypothetical protein
MATEKQQAPEDLKLVSEGFVASSPIFSTTAHWSWTMKPTTL